MCPTGAQMPVYQASFTVPHLCFNQVNGHQLEKLDVHINNQNDFIVVVV
jgi:hypothetical protein